jgi:hypothetical protein
MTDRIWIAIALILFTLAGYVAGYGDGKERRKAQP